MLVDVKYLSFIFKRQKIRKYFNSLTLKFNNPKHEQKFMENNISKDRFKFMMTLLLSMSLRPYAVRLGYS